MIHKKWSTNDNEENLKGYLNLISLHVPLTKHGQNTQLKNLLNRNLKCVRMRQ